MFEISALKEKKISELQEIATKLGIKKITTLKKMDLAYKIIDHYAANPKVNEEKAPEKVEKELKNTDKKPSENSEKMDTSSEVKTEKSVSNSHKQKANHFVKKEKNKNCYKRWGS